MEERLRSELRDYAWKYFSLHADQRIKTFNFYVILATFVVGGLITASNNGVSSWAVMVIAMTLPFISFIFWKLDLRNQELVGYAEEALRFLEKDERLSDSTEGPHPLRIFTVEECQSRRSATKKCLWLCPKHFRYSHCFNAVFLALSVAGALVAITTVQQMRNETPTQSASETPGKDTTASK